MSVATLERQQGSLLLLAVLLLLALGVVLVSGQQSSQDAMLYAMQYRRQAVITRQWVASALAQALSQSWWLTKKNHSCHSAAKNLTLCLTQLSTQHALLCASGQYFVLGPRIRYFRYVRLQAIVGEEKRVFLSPLPSGWLDYPPSGYEDVCP